jgi:hypothetical protein
MSATPLVRLLDAGCEDPELGPFACGECADNRDAAEASAAQLARAHALLRLIRRAEVKPVRSEGLEDDANAQLVLGHASAWAILKARIDLYFQTASER